MTRHLRSVLAVVSALWLAGCAASTGETAAPAPGKVSYAFDFASDPAKAGWTFDAGKGEGKMVYVESEGWYMDKGGKWTSPRIPAEKDPDQYYRMTFKSKSAIKHYYSVFFYTEDDKFIVADDYASVDKSADWAGNDIVFRARPKTHTFTINFISRNRVQVRDLKVWPISTSEAAAWCDKMYASLPALDYTADPGRWSKIPKTMEALREGKSIRIVMLGDSIINDTFNSNWHCLLARLYPEAKARVIASVRGGTGCWYYHEDKNFKEYVTDLKPDLLMIGGISNGKGGKGIENMRTVIRKAKERIGCEILVMSGPVGPDWRKHDKENPDAPLPVSDPPEVTPFYREMETMAKAEGVEFLDMYTPWHNYLGKSGKSWMYFHRDRVHADDRGKQILGRILERYFAPKK